MLHWPSRNERRQHGHRERDHEHDGRVDAREPIDERLARRALRLGALHQVNDPRQRRVAPEARDDHVERAAAVDRAGEHLVAGGFLDRKRLARHRRLVDVAVARCDAAVERDLFPGPDQHRVADRDVVDRDAHFAAVAPDERLGGREIHQRADRAARAIHRPRLEQLGEREEEDDRGGFRPFAEQRRPGHRDEHQHVDVEHAGPHGDDRAPCGIQTAERDREHEGDPHHRGRRGPHVLGEEAGGEGGARQHHEPLARRRRGGDRRRFLVLEPRAHAGLRDRFGDGGRRELARRHT